jgi:hypothetical protein
VRPAAFVREFSIDTRRMGNRSSVDFRRVNGCVFLSTAEIIEILHVNKRRKVKLWGGNSGP